MSMDVMYDGGVRNTNDTRVTESVLSGNGYGLRSTRRFHDVKEAWSGA